MRPPPSGADARAFACSPTRSVEHVRHIRVYRATCLRYTGAWGAPPRSRCGERPQLLAHLTAAGGGGCALHAVDHGYAKTCTNRFKRIRHAERMSVLSAPEHAERHEIVVFVFFAPESARGGHEGGDARVIC